MPLAETKTAIRQLHADFCLTRVRAWIAPSIWVQSKLPSGYFQ